MNYEQLSKYPLFNQIDDTEIESMLRCIGSFKRSYQKGEYIVFDGEHIKYVGLLLSGKIEVIKEDVWGEKSIVDIIPTMQVFGISFLFGNNDSKVSLVALENLKVLFLPFQQIMHTCKNTCKYHQKLVDNMLQLIAKKNILLLEKIEILSKKSIRAKILTYLSLYSQRVGKRQFEIPHGRIELADYLCVDRSALTRELGNMKEQGIIEFDKNTFKII